MTNQGDIPVSKPPRNANEARLSKIYIKTVYDLAMADNADLRFYCRVLDQNDAPVRGAQVRVVYSRNDESWIRNPRGEGPGAIYGTNVLVSDQQGRCAFVGGKARSLHVEEITKEDYLYNELGRSDFFQYTPRLVPQGKKALPDYMDPTAGTVLRLWRNAQQTERLVTVGRTAQLALPEQTDYEIPLLGDASSLKLKIHMPRMYPDDPAKPADRYVVYEVNDGEIQQTTDTYPYLAPQTGYSNQCVHAFEPSKRNVDGWNLPYYIRARNGKVFGALHIDFFKRTRGFTVTGYLNLNGSRNFQPDPEKLISDPEEIRRLDEATRVK